MEHDPTQSRIFLGPDDYIGMTEEEAVKFGARVMRRDTEIFMGTCDYDPFRRSVEIDNGIVTKAYAG